MNVYARDRYPANVKKQSFLVLEVYRLYLKNNMTGNLAKRKKLRQSPFQAIFPLASSNLNKINLFNDNENLMKFS